MMRRTQIYFDPTEHLLYKNLAAENGQTLSEYIRRVMSSVGAEKIPQNKTISAMAYARKLISSLPVSKGKKVNIGVNARKLAYEHLTK